MQKSYDYRALVPPPTHTHTHTARQLQHKPPSPSSTDGRSSTSKRASTTTNPAPTTRSALPEGMPPSGVDPRLQARAWRRTAISSARVRTAASDRHAVRGPRPDHRVRNPRLAAARLDAPTALPDDPVVHACVVTYLSDMTLLDTVLRPFGMSVMNSNLMMASLDHAMWFHRPFRADEWLLYEQTTFSSSNARGLAGGSIFTADGRPWSTSCKRA